MAIARWDRRRRRRAVERQQRAARHYLAGATVGAWFTKQALRPVPLPRPTSIPSFFAGWLTNELVFHHAAWQAAATSWFVRRGALRHPQGRLALALTLAQWAGMGKIAKDVFATRPVLERALEDAFRGEQPLEQDEQETTPVGLRWGQLVAPLPMRAPGVERVRAITFCRAGGRDLHLDVFRRSDRPTGRPVILFIHGGAWVISSRDEQGLPLMHEMAARGWVGVNADYRLSPFASFPDQVIDVKRAIAWIREHADEIGADPSFIAIAGGSAGGHLAALAALTPDVKELAAGFEGDDTSVQAAVAFYGVYDFLNRHGGHHETFTRFIARFVMKTTPQEDPELYRLASPIDHVGPDAPPFFVIQPERDTLTPVAGARAFVEALRRESRAPVAYAELPGAQHAFDVFPSLRTAYVLHAVARFLDQVYARSRVASRDGARPADRSS